MSRVSPAASAAVIGKLARAGIPRSREVGNRVFTHGFDVFPRADCLEVVYFLRSDEDASDRRAVLERAKLALADYDVTMRHGPATAIGGTEVQDYLDVRSERWGR